MHLPEQEYNGSNIVQIRPQENITTGAFSGQATFIIDIAKDEMIIPKSIYMSARVSLSSSEFVTATNALDTGNLPLGMTSTTVTNTKTVGCIASGGIDNLFNKMQHEISGISTGSSVVQNIENYQQTCSLLRLNHEHPNIACKNSIDPFILKEKGKFLNTTAIFNDANHSRLSQVVNNNFIDETPIEYVLRNAYQQGLVYNNEISLSTRPPVAMFMQEGKLYQGQHILRFTIDPDFRRKFVNAINIVGTNTTILGAVTAFNGSYAEDSTVSNRIGVSINDLYLYVEYVKINLPMGRPIGKHLHVFESWNTTQHACPNGNSDNFILPCKANLLKIIIGFRRSSVITNGGVQQALFIPEMPGFNQINLNQIYIKYLSDTYPQTNYSMKLINSYPFSADALLNRYVPSTNIGTNFDTVRAYEDYLINSDIESPEEAMTFDQWCSNPIFVFKFCNQTSQSSNVEVNLSCNSSVGTVFDSEFLINAGRILNGVATPNELNGVIMYLTYIYRIVVESDFGEDSVNYRVYNVA